MPVRPPHFLSPIQSGRIATKIPSWSYLSLEWINIPEQRSRSRSLELQRIRNVLRHGSREWTIRACVMALELEGEREKSKTSLDIFRVFYPLLEGKNGQVYNNMYTGYTCLRCRCYLDSSTRALATILHPLQVMKYVSWLRACVELSDYSGLIEEPKWTRFICTFSGGLASG